MIALSCILFSFVCLAHSRSYHYGHFNHGSQEDGFCAGKANGNYRDPENCYGFITCSKQITYKMNCPDNLKYNEKTDQCDWPWNVQCEQEDGFCAGKANGNYRDPDNCYGFITCSKQITYKMNCPDNLKYNEKMDQCDWPWNVQCEQGGTGCQEGSTSFDNCGQRCKCIGGQLVNCVRIRKEFTSLTDAERKRHIDTILTVSAKNGPFRAEYEDLINEHHTLFNTSIHRQKHFIPWHRYYILRYENLMRKADCTFTVTYWDWSSDSREPFSTGPNNVWNNDTGFGGDGVDAQQNCVLDGPFRRGAWIRVRPRINPLPLPDCLTRNFSGNVTGEVDLMRVLSIDDFTQFEFALRRELHNNVHCQIGETMCTTEAASAPEFFLHHGFVDKIWDDWQKKSLAHKCAYFPTVQKKMPGTNLRPAQLIDLSNQPGGVRVEYEPFRPEERIRSRLGGLSLSQLQQQQRRPFTGLSSQAIRLFQISTAELKKIRELEKWIDPNVIVPEN